MKPHIIQSMETFILPTAWKSFSYTSVRAMTGENRNARFEYSSAILITVSSEENIPRNAGMTAMDSTVRATP